MGYDKIKLKANVRSPQCFLRVKAKLLQPSVGSMFHNLQYMRCGTTQGTFETSISGDAQSSVSTHDCGHTDNRRSQSLRNSDHSLLSPIPQRQLFELFPEAKQSYQDNNTHHRIHLNLCEYSKIYVR